MIHHSHILEKKLKMPGKPFTSEQLAEQSGEITVHDASTKCTRTISFDGYKIDTRRTVSSQCQIWYYIKLGSDKTIAMKRRKIVDGAKINYEWTYYVLSVDEKLPAERRRTKTALPKPPSGRIKKRTSKDVVSVHQKFSFLRSANFD